ncbi:MAG: hypothetical protein JXM68_12660 [Sedimentisphaerales bacterium]|nr:hypothetical protein [Sedimentisphaerales bacterium]
MKKFISFMAAMLVAAVANAGLTISFTTATLESPLVATLTDGNSSMTFNTFCLQENVPFAQNADAEISNNIKFSAQAPTTLEVATKQLYAAYLNNSSLFDAELVQADIWTMESLASGYANVPYYAPPTYISGQTGGPWALAGSYDITGWEHVKVVNVKLGGKDGQDVLIRVPAPAAVLLAGFGTTLIGLVRRRTM